MAVTYPASLFYQHAGHFFRTGLLAQIDTRLTLLAGTLYTIQSNGASRLIPVLNLLHPHLRPVDGDRIIHKRHGNAFEDTDLDGELKSRNVGTLVVTGQVTHGCVRATCIGANKLG